MDKRLSRRVDKIERRLKPEKGEWLKFPDGKGGYIEVPHCYSLIDVAAIVGIGSDYAGVDETERK